MWTYFLTWLVTTAISIALTPKPPKLKPASLSDFEFPTAEEGRPIPVVFGTVEITGANVTWYGDLATEAIKQSSLFSSTTVGYKYFLGLQFCLCHGPVNAVTKITIGGKLGTDTPVTSSGTMVIDKWDLFGGPKREGGIVADVDIGFGESTIGANIYLQSVLTPAIVPAYRGVLCAYVHDGTEPGYIGTSPYPKPWAFTVKRTTAGWNTGTAWYAAKAEITGGHLNGAHILYECLTNPEWGMGVDTTLMDDTAWRAAADTLYTEGFGLSLIWNQQESIESFCQIILDHVAGAIAFDLTTGKYALKLIRGDYDPDTLPTLDESNILSLDKREVRGWGETINEITVVFTDPTQGKDTAITATDLANVAIQGRIAQTISLPGIRTATLAGRVAQRELISRATPLASITLKVNREVWDTTQGSLFKLNWAKHGFSGVIFRALKVSRGTLEDNSITIDALQDVYGFSSGIYTGSVSAPADPAPPIYEDPVVEGGGFVTGRASSPPGGLIAAGSRYYVTSPASGAWVGHAGEVAFYNELDSTWTFEGVSDGTVVYDQTAGLHVTLNSDGSTDPAPWLEWVGVPASATAAGVAGQVAYASGFIYVCVATNTWQRVALTTW